MSENIYMPVLIRIAVALERLVEQPPAGVEAVRGRRKSKLKEPDAAVTDDTTSMTGDMPTAPVDVDNDDAMRAHAGERIRQLVAQASEIGCSMADIEEVVADNTGPADIAALDQNTLSQLIIGLTRLIKSHSTPAEQSEADKQTRAIVLEQIRTLTKSAAATDEGLAATVTIMRSHAGGDGAVDHLELAQLQALLAAMQANTSTAASAT